ncbi:6800_t:CDS:2 [Ambispora leptoticha]|uniref:6800_t:CDS:1 n=1 Tax=Ambispora leptoticha TaxID=144679 RepID=A0A9N9H2Q2_9GLOM|nr:6800_t:CDS:2 [Ambispora leptoticha]
MPQRWRETNTLNEDDNKEINKFNKFSFVADFLGHDPKKPTRPRFWEMFISHNPDGQYETEDDELDEESGEPTGQKEKIDIEKKESGQLSSYDGEFESPRLPKLEETLGNNMPQMPRLLAQSSDALNQSLENLRQEIEVLNQQMQTSSAANNSTLLQNSINDLYKLVAGFVAGSVIDTDAKKRENENKQLNLKGEISKQIREEINNLQNDRSQEASQLNNLDQQIAQKQNKLNDPNTPEHEKAQIRSELASLVSQRSSIQTRIRALDDKIESLIKQGNKTVTGGTGLANIELDYNTKLMIGAIIFLIIYFTFIKEKDNS